MKVHIENNLYLESDPYQYLLKEYSGKTYTNKKGEEIEGYSTLGHFGTINQAIKYLMEMKIKESTAKNLTELLREVQQIKKDINKKITV